MTDKFDGQETFINKPYNEAQLQEKLNGVRQSVGKKLNSWADRIQVSMAFIPKVQHVEGERWEENGKTWTIKNGLRQSISVLDAARMPHWCPKCSKPMNNRFDRKFFFFFYGAGALIAT